MSEETKPSIATETAQASRLKRITRLFFQFAYGQAGIQVISFLTGLYLLRALSVLDYAQYSAAFAFQTTLSLLVDLGFSGSIVALVGDRGHEAITIGHYIRAARHYRLRMFVLLAASSAVVFPLLMIRQPWGAPTKVALWISIVAAVFFQGNIMYSAPLLIHRQLNPFYRAQLGPNAGRLALLFVFRLTRQLNGWIAACISSATVAVTGWFYKRQATPFYEEPTEPEREVLREMRNYVTPLWPALIYFAFQGQITLALISFFGKSHNIAEVAALGRLGQLFAFFGAMNSVLVEPYIAQVHHNLVLKRYVQIGSLAVLFGALITGLAYLFPGLFLLLLGPHYTNLREYIWMTVLGASASYASGVLIYMNGARKWVYWPTTVGSTAFVLVCQVIAVSRLDLSTTRSMVIFGMTMPISALLSVAMIGVYGYRRSSREYRKSLEVEAS